MYRGYRFTLAFVLGMAALLVLETLARAGGAAAAPTAARNGDINGDGTVDLTDAIRLLNFLFRGEAPPVEIHCDQPIEDGARFRFLNDVTCNGGSILASVELCGGGSLTRLTNEAVGECQELPPESGCAVKVSADTPCGSFEFCTDIDATADLVYDFVLAFDGSGPTVLLFAQPLSSEQTCPAFPTPGMPITQIVPIGCAGAGGGAALGPAHWAGAGGW